MARDKESPPPLTPREELLLKVAKEIVVKFIEVGASPRLPLPTPLPWSSTPCANPLRAGAKGKRGKGEKVAETEGLSARRPWFARRRSGQSCMGLRPSHKA